MSSTTIALPVLVILVALIIHVEILINRAQLASRTWSSPDAFLSNDIRRFLGPVLGATLGLAGDPDFRLAAAAVLVSFYLFPLIRILNSSPPLAIAKLHGINFSIVILAVLVLIFWGNARDAEKQELPDSNSTRAEHSSSPINDTYLAVYSSGDMCRLIFGHAALK